MFITLTTRAHKERPNKRARRTLACSRCRQRKIKCDFDGHNVRCSKCIVAKVDCNPHENNPAGDQEQEEAEDDPQLSTATPASYAEQYNSPPLRSASSPPYSQVTVQAEPAGPIPSPQTFPHFDGLDLLSQASLQHDMRNVQQDLSPGPPSIIEAPLERGNKDDTTLSSILEANTGTSAISTTASSPTSFHFIGNTNPLSCLLQEQDKAKIVDRTAGYRALVPRRPPRSARPTREYPGQNIVALDWYGAFAAAGFNTYQLRFLDKSGCFSLPPDAVIFSLTTAYFERVHPLYPVIDRPEFEAQLHAHDAADLPPLILLHAVLLMGARFSTNPYVLGSTTGSRQYCDQLYSKARLLYVADLGFETLAMIQAGLLMSLHWEGLDGSNTALSHLSSAIRLAQSIGCHRQPTTRKLKGHPFVTKPSPTDAPRQLAVLKRIWWSAIAIDRFTAITEGISTVIGDHDASLLDPLGPEDFEFEEPLVCAVSRANVHLAGILCRILRTHYQPETERRSESAVDSTTQAQWVENRIRLELQLSQFPSQLDKDLRLPSRLSPNGPVAQIWAAYLHLHYLAAVILLHRPYIPIPSSGQEAASGQSDLSEMNNPLGTASVEACRRASNDVVTLLSSLSEIDALRFSWPFSVYTVVSALLISFQDFRVRDVEVAKQAAARYDTIIELLRQMAGTWWAAAAKYRLSLVIKEGFVRSSNRPIFSAQQSPPFINDRDSWMETDTGQQPCIPLDDGFWNTLGLDPSIFGPAGNFNSEL